MFIFGATAASEITNTVHRGVLNSTHSNLVLNILAWSTWRKSTLLRANYVHSPDTIRTISTRYLSEKKRRNLR